jgi:hypothetical protein
MTEPEMVDEDARRRRRMALTYAIVSVLLLASCCVFAVWFTHSLRDAVLGVLNSN